MQRAIISLFCHKSPWHHYKLISNFVHFLGIERSLMLIKTFPENFSHFFSNSMSLKNTKTFILRKLLATHNDFSEKHSPCARFLHPQTPFIISFCRKQIWLQNSSSSSYFLLCFFRSGAVIYDEIEENSAGVYLFWRQKCNASRSSLSFAAFFIKEQTANYSMFFICCCSVVMLAKANLNFLQFSLSFPTETHHS